MASEHSIRRGLSDSCFRFTAPASSSLPPPSPTAIVSACLPLSRGRVEYAPAGLLRARARPETTTLGGVESGEVAALEQDVHAVRTGTRRTREDASRRGEVHWHKNLLSPYPYTEALHRVWERQQEAAQ